MEYNVIWIDDEWDTRGRPFIQTCKVKHHIMITPFKTRKQGMEALEQNLKFWDAVILDARAYNNSVTEESPELDGLIQARERMIELRSKRAIPFFVFTRQPDLISDKMFEKMVGKYYRKDEEGQRQLLMDLKNEIDNSPRFQVKSLYQDAIEQLYYLNQNAGEVIIDILEAMHFPGSHPLFNPILYYNQLRQILEYNFRAANKVGIIPDKCFDKKDNPNLSQCSHYLSGNNATEAKVRYGECRGKDDYDKIVPKHIELMMRMILDLGNINSHSVKLSDSEEEELEYYFNNNVFNSRYLIYSLTLNACEITLWFKNYIKSHQNIEENKKMCRPIPDNQTTSKDIDKTEINEDELIGVVMCDNGIYHIGSRFFVNKNYIDRNSMLNKKVRIVEHDINNNSGTKEKYPYFACKVKPVNE